MVKLWFKTYQLLPNDFGALTSSEFPRFFEIETALMVFASIVLVLGGVGFILMLAELFGFIKVASISTYIMFIVIMLLLSAIINQTVRILLSRTMNSDQFNWAISAFSELELVSPTSKMTKVDLSKYIEAAYKYKRSREIV